MTNIDDKIKTWKNKLLDLGRRNRLLNYKDTTKSTLKITFPSYNELYDRLVRNECALAFPMPNLFEDGEENGESENALYDTMPLLAEDYGDFSSDLRTNKNVKELQKILRALRNKAKLAVEEQGINILYLCFGFLEWTEADHSGIINKSPLILVPVTLTLESLTSPFVLSLHEDEITENPTLAYKLQNDFGITLPKFDESSSLDDYYAQIRETVKIKNWKVNTDVGMSLLSFLKINMYDDLNKHHDSIASNPIVRALGGDVTGLQTIPENMADIDFDKNTKPRDVFQVVDADASQQEAILLAKKGVSFVLQGPPGTGKSQTITNIIAESLADGKKVLFVSEKMAALDVVHRRLTLAGLDDFCLVLHSHKANKRNVLDQLEKVLKLSQKKATLSDEAYRKLDNLQYDRQKLNEYADQLFETVEPLGKTIYEANGIIANLEAVPDVIFQINDIKATTKDRYNNYLFLLSQFAATIGKMTDDYKNNPWRGATMPAVTNEFRHDANAILPATVQTLNESIEAISNCYQQIDSVFPLSIDGVNAAIRVLDSLKNSFEVPSEWVLGKSELPIIEEITDYSDKQNKCKTIIAEIVNNYSLLSGNAVLDPVNADEFFSMGTQEKQMQTIEYILFHSDPYVRWTDANYNEATGLLGAAKETADVIISTISALSEHYEKGIFDIDYIGMLGRFKTEYTSITKYFKKSYKEDKKQFQLFSKEVGKKISDAEALSVIDKLKYINEKRSWFADNKTRLNELFGSDIISEGSDFEKVSRHMTMYSLLRKTHDQIGALYIISSELAASESIVREHFGSIYNGMFTNWDEAKAAWDWAIRFRKTVEDERPSTAFVERVCSSKEYAVDCCKIGEQLSKANANAQKSIAWIASFFEQPNEFTEMKMDTLRDRMEACRNGLSLLEEWIDFRTSRKNCADGGLDSYISAIENENIPAANITPIFKKRFYRLWLDAVLPDYPAVLTFRRKQQDSVVAEFASLDTDQFGIARARIKSKLINDLPSLDHFTSGVDEISILKKELAKQRKIMPIRKLFKEIPNLLLTLKPCLMMSPLSVSLFLEADSYKFDIVIFDEASQVYTENAIGAIARGKQVVIAGDSKQLPPTNFFQSAVSENEFDTDDDDENDTTVFDSILDEANMLPERTLQWHYRSRHESLIAFSNAKIYKNQLITFPSNIERGIGNGVEYIHVPNGYYDRGGRKGNVIEAKRVAELVFEHFKTQPKRSLGVIAFGEVQQLAIENALRDMRLQNGAYEEFFDENKDEAFFVKSLENVQGDERDTIIFSIGYAPDASGAFRMNFGPLGKSGGERRLNVAITRAKYNIKLVGSILPKDINVDAISTEGPKLLRAYMDFAINGDSVLEKEITSSDIEEHDSPFEEAVYKYLDRKGYKLATQVGCSGYRIDIGVKHPSDSGVFVLGVECDGASYHSARTARERDRLRQDVLENMGWTIYRIWSTDWIKDPAAEGQRLIEAIEKAIISYNDGNDTLYTEPEATEETNSFVEIEKKETDNDKENPYGFSEFTETTFSSVPRNIWGSLNLDDCLNAVIMNEYPVHYDIMCQRVAGLLGNEKATVKVRREVDYALSRMFGFVRKGDFFFPMNYTDIPIRLPNHRKIQFICTEELATAMLKILKTYVGTTRKSLADETARVYGFSRSGQNITAAMNEAIDCLMKQGKVEEIDGKLRLK